ncbi:N-acetylmuramoyl-L-alanine amidase [Alkalihalobacillus sp. LMS39]|uniref:N-acetylmuramoyl-L-alanine amidase n=1 Tax=Alkalihalobacillus sp. LMS39 TaxID=2924032 RepID=UPI001FB4F476|nr:N-acetylmuramoyl-L-alanine amidase [Alkalihalobacillus sp. LMS39]UOE95345.1 N-acetylmuramoyl-L-alanine amidase [Alkalihalobacillus sp. LMS39]
MTKIFIDPGHGGDDAGAEANGLQEKEIVLDISLHIRDMLLNEYEDVEVKMSRDSDVFVELSERAQMANDWGADYFISVHSNAGGGTGFESYIHTSQAERTVELQNIVHDAIVEEIDVNDRGKMTANFVVLRETAMPAILTENLFVDNENDAELLSDPAFLETIARGHVNGIAEAFQLEQSNDTPPQETIYKVQVGAFQEEANARRLATQLEDDGYTPYVYRNGDLWKVQVGAFRNRENAERLKEELEDKGYDVFLVVQN